LPSRSKSKQPEGIDFWQLTEKTRKNHENKAFERTGRKFGYYLVVNCKEH
jgi:hypothetical protein